MVDVFARKCGQSGKALQRQLHTAIGFADSVRLLLSLLLLLLLLLL